MDRVARQASDLEERLARLATSMSPTTDVIDPEVTQISEKIKRQTVSSNSFSGESSVIERGQQGFVEFAPKPRTNPLLFIGAAVVALLLVGGAIGGYVLLKPNPTPPINNNQVVVTTDPPTMKADLVEIPGGTFQMGRNDGTPQERPQHSEAVPTFLMDRAEVTNEEYRICP